LPRTIITIVVLAVSLPAQLSLTPVGSFTHPVFAGNGTIGVCKDSFSNDVWVVDFSNTVNLHRFSQTGTLLSSHPTNTCTPSMTSPNDLTQDRATGDLWLVDNDSPGKVLRFSTTGACLSGGFTLGSLYLNPVSMTVVPGTQNLLIGHTGATVLWSMAGTNLNGGFSVAGFLTSGTIISGITAYPLTGNYLLTSSGGNTVYEVTPTGTLVSTTPLASYGVNNIQALDFDPSSGLLVVADNTTVTIHMFQLATGPQFQTNQPEASLDLNGLVGTSFAPATLTVPINQIVTLNGSSTLTGAGWDIVVSTVPLLSVFQGAPVLPDGQILNINFFDPGLFFINGFFNGPPFANFAAPFSVGAPINFSAQMAVLDPSIPTQVRLSQPVRLIVQ
jgi:hypothetical protein